MRLACLRAPAQHRGVIDHHAGFARVHQRQEGAAHAEHAGQADIDHFVPLLIGHLRDRGLAAETCVVDKDIEMAEFFDGGVAQVLDIVLLGDIADAGVGTLSGFGFDTFSGFLQAAFVEIADKQRCAFFGGAFGDGKTNAGACGGGDEGGFAFEEVSGFWIFGDG